MNGRSLAKVMIGTVFLAVNVTRADDERPITHIKQANTASKWTRLKKIFPNFGQYEDVFYQISRFVPEFHKHACGKRVFCLTSSVFFFAGCCLSAAKVLGGLPFSQQT